LRESFLQHNPKKPAYIFKPNHRENHRDSQGEFDMGRRPLFGRLPLLILLLVAAAIAVPVLYLGLGKDDEAVPVPVAEGPGVKVLLCESGQVLDFPLEQYVVGVVAAEMPAAFPVEALKAQAVAARTYTLKRLGGKANEAHSQADVCTDFNHCQAWIDKDEMRNRWGTSYDQFYGKICTAVAETKGMAIYYQGSFIDPVYHSTSNGRTENSEDVWGTKVPYLRSVASPWDKESPKFKDVIKVPWEEVNKKVSTAEGVIQVSTVGGGAPIIRPLEYTATGRLKRVQVGARAIASTQLRLALGLPSTDLRWTVNKGMVTFSARGNGHGVGMSQYGAKGMALEGYSFQEILCHYFTGVKIQSAY
jgi:stage II sporulation protein D